MRFPCPHCDQVVVLGEHASTSAVMCPACGKPVTAFGAKGTVAVRRVPAGGAASSGKRRAQVGHTTRHRRAHRRRSIGLSVMLVMVSLLAAVVVLGWVKYARATATPQTAPVASVRTQDTPVSEIVGAAAPHAVPSSAATTLPPHTPTVIAAAPLPAPSSTAAPAPVLDPASRAAVMWLLDHRDNLPRAVTLLQDVPLGRASSVLPSGRTVPFGRIIDADTVTILVDGDHHRIPASVTDIGARALAAKAMAEADAAGTATVEAAPTPSP